MSQIPTSQGAVKVSEVQTDVAQNTFGTLDREDGLTLVTQIRNVCANLLRKTSFLLTSDGQITWNGTNITSNGNNVFLKFNQNPAVGVVTVTIPTAVLAGFTLANAQVLYFQTTRNALAASFTANSSNIVVASEGAMPAAFATQNDASVDPTIIVPILARYDVGSNQSVWWVPHGIYWPQNTSSIVGSIISSTTSPIGSFSALHLFGDPVPLGSPALEVIAPGWNLCSGCVIINQQSGRANPGRNADGFPNVSYSSSNDRFTPQMNGAFQPFANGTNYVRGDLVRNSGSTQEWAAMSSFTGVSGTLGNDPNLGLPASWSSGTAYTAGQYVLQAESNVNGSGQGYTGIYRAINNVGPSATTPFNDTTNWQKIWSVDLTQNGSPFKRSGVNNSPSDGANPITSIMGNTASPASASGYFGENQHTQTVAEMASHSHSLFDPGHQHGMARPGGNIGDNGGGIGAEFTVTYGAGPINKVTAPSGTGMSVNGNGGSTPFGIVQRSFAAPWIIKIY